MKRVVVGMSGGVDSSVSAYLLKEQGYDVIGIFMRNWHDETVTISNDCPWIDDSNDAMLVAEKLNIPFQVLDLSVDYKSRIVDYMFAEYEAGRTPNPDVLCNREIKFDIFLEAALKLKADFVATGHYCQKSSFQKDGKEIFQLISGADKNKDQSYFLCQLNQQQLSKALFPIGHLQKSEVRKIALEQGLATAEKKDSQGLCFVGKIKLPDFLQQQLQPKKGIVIEILENAKALQQGALLPLEENYEEEVLAEKAQKFDFANIKGKFAGEHNGAHYYTIGQRKGLAIGGKEKPLFVIGTNTETNIVYTGMSDEHPGLYHQALFIPNKDEHWIREDLRLQVNQSAEYFVRIRYRQTLVRARLYKKESGLYILFEKNMKGIAPGQFAAWYNNEELIGSGVIN